MKRVGLFFGGMSNEAEVSVISARNIVANIDKNIYELMLIFWDRQGKFWIVPDIDSRENGIEILPVDFIKHFDIAFPITHGKFGEDGVLQAIFESSRTPYCGCRVLSSALCMDKAVFRTLLSAHNIPQARFASWDYKAATDTEIENAKKIAQEFKLPWFVKPANSGSSVGITMVTNPDQLDAAIAAAREHDSKILIEEGFTDHHEIELAVLGNSDLTISPPGELKPSEDFYTYEDKYELNKTEFIIPANISVELADEAKSLAEQVYRLCDCRGFARIDMFESGGKIFLNEINTLPGFTDISMYPRLMRECGVSYPELISRIIQLAY